MPLKPQEEERLDDDLLPRFSGKRRSGFDPLKLIEGADAQTLVLALVATNPSLDDLLPDDPKLRADLHDIRARITQRQLALNADASEIKNVVHQHVHVHLWDQHTQDRLKSFGRSIIDFVILTKNKVVEAKAALIDNDARETISATEALRDFKIAFKSMVLFMLSRDSTIPPHEREKSSLDDSAGITEDMNSFFPDRDDQVAAVRLIASAIEEPLGEQLGKVKDAPSAPPVSAKTGKKKTFQFRSASYGPGM